MNASNCENLLQWKLCFNSQFKYLDFTYSSHISRVGPSNEWNWIFSTGFEPVTSLSWLERRTGVARSRVQTPLKSWLFQVSIHNCLNCVHNCDDHSLLDFKSAAQYMKHFIYHFTSILHGLIRTHKWPTPNVSGFIAQLVRASHRCREVTGSNPVEVLTFSGFYTQLLKLRS